MITDERAGEYARVTNLVTQWARGKDDIVGVAVVGSWARDAARMDSDVDLVVVTTERWRYATDDGWIADAVGEEGDLVRTQAWGPLLERRIRLTDGLEIEFGFVAPSWAMTDPVDAGTARVVRDGCRPLLDGERLFDGLIAAVS